MNSSARSRNSPDYNGLALRMKPACIKARVARKSRGPKRPYGFDSRPEHIGQFLGIVRFYKSLIISTLLLSGFICQQLSTMVINNIILIESPLADNLPAFSKQDLYKKIIYRGKVLYIKRSCLSDGIVIQIYRVIDIILTVEVIQDQIAIIKSVRSTA